MPTGAPYENGGGLIGDARIRLRRSASVAPWGEARSASGGYVIGPTAGLAKSQHSWHNAATRALKAAMPSSLR